MQTDIFISYARRDQEFVARLATDLDALVASVWFDPSTIQVGKNWHDEIMLVIGIVNIKNPPADCASLGTGNCLSQIFGNAMAERRAIILWVSVIFFLFLKVVWFLTGMLAGWLVVRHVRRLEPGITRGQGWQVGNRLGCGAILAALVAVLTISLLAKTFGL